ncbi:MAG: cytochrome b/b6 domain-containing protein [Pseudomonadota bacterium]
MKKRTSIFLRRGITTCVTVAAVSLALVVFLVSDRVFAQQPTPAPAEIKADTAPAKASEKEAGETKKEKAGDKSEEITNDSCLDCHTPDILKMSKDELADQVDVGDEAQPPRKKPLFVFGELNLSIDKDKYEAGVHGQTGCTECHKDVSESPHKQRLEAVDCAQCHDEAVESVQAGVHGGKGRKGVDPGCIGCHNVHYGKGKDDDAKGWTGKYCVDCHKAYGLDTVAAHAHLYEPQLHMKLGCMACHKGKQAGVHNILPAKTKTAKCESCHNVVTTLSKTKPEALALKEYLFQTTFTNPDVLKKYSYVVGAHRIPALDLIIILAVIAPFGLPLVHGGLRILTRRKEPLELPTETILLHPIVERIWHWTQALCIVMLVITGVLIHWPERFPGWFEWAVRMHNWFGWGAVIAFVVWLIYNLGTGRISHYIPKAWEIPGGMITQARFYGYGIFKHEPHPYAPSEDNKFNPLQKIAYLQFQLLLLPLLLISGILYMYPETFKGAINAMGGPAVLAVIHYILGGLFAAFLVAHIYLATTGETIGENFKAIITGKGLKSDHHDHHHKA